MGYQECRGADGTVSGLPSTWLEAAVPHRACTPIPNIITLKRLTIMLRAAMAFSLRDLLS
jgi:hypothetical protein